MDKINVDQLITLADISEDALYNLYTESISKLRSNSITSQERKECAIRVMYIRSIISDRYSLKASHRTPDFANPMSNPQVNRFYK